MHREIVHSVSRAKLCTQRFGADCSARAFHFQHVLLVAGNLAGCANRCARDLFLWTARSNLERHIFGANDEPNYSYALGGRKSLLVRWPLGYTPVYVRVHNLLTSGDGSSSLKWAFYLCLYGGCRKKVYSWTILDQIFDAFHAEGDSAQFAGFTPQALSTHPQPYRHNFPSGGYLHGVGIKKRIIISGLNSCFSLGAIFASVTAMRKVEGWPREVWNEPDIPYWKGMPEDYLKLYDFLADATWRALPAARIGGPDSTGPGLSKGG